MTTLAVSAGIVLALALAACVLVARSRRRSHVRANRRAAALERLARSLELVTRELRWGTSDTRPARPVDAARRPAPPLDPTTGLPARAALVDELGERITEATRAKSRLALALVAVDAGGTSLEPAVAATARAARLAAPNANAFRAGERELALVLPAAGRAEAFAAIARLEATLEREPHLSSSVVELGDGEDAAELLARAVAHLAEGRSRN